MVDVRYLFGNYRIQFQWRHNLISFTSPFGFATIDASVIPTPTSRNFHWYVKFASYVLTRSHTKSPERPTKVSSSQKQVWGKSKHFSFFEQKVSNSACLTPRSRVFGRFEHSTFMVRGCTFWDVFSKMQSFMFCFHVRSLALSPIVHGHKKC